MRRTERRLLKAGALLLAGLAGCRNPFDPSSDVELAQVWNSRGGQNVLIYATEIPASGSLNLDPYVIRFDVLIRNKVDVTLTSATATFTDVNGVPVTPYQSTGGKSFTIFQRVEGVTNNDEFSNSEGRVTSFGLFIVDTRVVQTFQNTPPPGNIMYCRIVLRGEDENGYDVRLEGQIPILYFP
jgi:hypothetical protein